MGRSITDTSDFMIPPNTLIVFTVYIENPAIMKETNCDNFESSIYFSSFQAPNFEIPLSYQVLLGDITLFPSDMVRFPPAIPGITQTKDILARSTLSKSVYIKSVTSSNPNKVVAEIVSNTLEPRTNKEIIKISTVPFDQVNSFLKMRNNAFFHYFIQNGFKSRSATDHRVFNPILTYFDILAWQVEQKEWENRQSTRSTDETSTITIETNMIQNISIPVRTVITKPTLLNQDKYDFGKIEVETEKRGSITVHNPSPNPIEVSFFIAPPNFLDLIIEKLLSDEKLLYWKQICDKSTFFNPYGRKMCEGFIELYMLPEPRRKAVVDYFIRNYFNFITNGDIKDHTLKRFISDQQLYLQQTVQNISDATSAIKPPVKKEIPPHDSLEDYYSVITKVRFRFSFSINCLSVAIHFVAKERISQKRTP